MDRLNDIIVNMRFGYYGVRFEHPFLTNTDSFDSFLTFVKVKSRNGLPELYDYNRSGVLSVLKRMCELFSGQLMPEHQSNEVKELWARMISDQLRDFTGSPKSFVWPQLRGETEILFFYRCSVPDCPLAVSDDLLPVLDSSVDTQRLGFPSVSRSKIYCLSGDVDADLRGFTAICTACKAPAKETWPILPASTWILRYYKPSQVFQKQEMIDSPPNNLMEWFETKRGIFTLSYIEVRLVCGSGEENAPVHLEHCAIFYLNARYFIYDSRVSAGLLNPLDRNFTWDQVISYLGQERRILRSYWVNAVYSKVFTPSDRVAGSNPPSRNTSASTGGSCESNRS